MDQDSVWNLREFKFYLTVHTNYKCGIAIKIFIRVQCVIEESCLYFKSNRNYILVFLTRYPQSSGLGKDLHQVESKCVKINTAKNRNLTDKID